MIDATCGSLECSRKEMHIASSADQSEEASPADSFRYPFALPPGQPQYFRQVHLFLRFCCSDCLSSRDPDHRYPCPNLRRNKSFVPNNFTFTSLAKSCGLSRCLYLGMQMHSEVVKLGFCLDLYVSTALVDMYAKLGKLCFAHNVFDEMTQRSLVSWTALIGGYVRSGNMSRARMLFDQMEEKDCAVYNAMIDGYIKVGDMDSARSLFDKMPYRNVITRTTMIHGYCNVGDVQSARFLFDSMPGKNLYSWNAMIGGYCQNKQPHEAVGLFRVMQCNTSLEPDKVTVVSILPAIADLGAVELGRWIHHYIQRKKLDRSTKVCTSLVDMYAKCGEITKARKVFDQMPTKETTTWNALINGLAVNGGARKAMQVFMDMQLEGVKPNDVTMLGVLSACNHGGLIEEGRRWFKAMDGFNLSPKIEHYGCMIDLLGRGGCLEEAENLINSMPFEANGIILSSFLSACVYSKDLTRAERLLDEAVKLEPWNDGNYVMLGKLYAQDKRWGQVEEVKSLMKRNGAKKEAGSSAIEVDGEVSEFISGGREHHRWEEIRAVIGQLRDQMEDFAKLLAPL
ncbi:Pentatricopeptide repeat-containing protein At2g44880 [Linum perenne]